MAQRRASSSPWRHPKCHPVSPAGRNRHLGNRVGQTRRRRQVHAVGDQRAGREHLRLGRRGPAASVDAGVRVAIAGRQGHRGLPRPDGSQSAGLPDSGHHLDERREKVEGRRSLQIGRSGRICADEHRFRRSVGCGRVHGHRSQSHGRGQNDGQTGRAASQVGRTSDGAGGVDSSARRQRRRRRSNQIDGRYGRKSDPGRRLDDLVTVDGDKIIR